MKEEGLGCVVMWKVLIRLLFFDAVEMHQLSICDTELDFGIQHNGSKMRYEMNPRGILCPKVPIISPSLTQYSF